MRFSCWHLNLLLSRCQFGCYCAKCSWKSLYQDNSRERWFISVASMRAIILCPSVCLIASVVRVRVHMPVWMCACVQVCVCAPMCICVRVFKRERRERDIGRESERERENLHLISYNLPVPPPKTVFPGSTRNMSHHNASRHWDSGDLFQNHYKLSWTETK